ncbi:MAG: hypothetical protein M1818_004291 [Claussenomyces sp. TS43310]|nr:MAG: hypothetical protein M1818_004291 [Claussenomyces sp. TS43310]
MPRALTIHQVEGKPGKVYYPLSLDDVPPPTPRPNELTVQMHACALNHRDLFIRQHLYPKTTFSVPLLADGMGIVSAPSSSPLLHKRVILTPGYGWDSDPAGPESEYAILGGTSTCPIGTAQDVVCVPSGEVEEVPEHLSNVEAASLPLTGLTGWRALVTKSGNAQPGRNILVTGIGGGVALMILLFGVAKGCKIWVTSGSEEKIAKAREMGAQGGVIYKEDGWEKKLLKMLPKERPLFDAIIDGAGGDIINKAAKICKVGGVVVQYGMTLSPKMDWSMNAVLKNIDLKGSTMGSRKEFKEMVQFVRETKITPVVSRVVKGLDNINEIDELFVSMKKGSQFGKLVVEIVPERGSSPSKL